MLCVPTQVMEPSDVGLFHPKASSTGNDVVIILCFWTTAPFFWLYRKKKTTVIDFDN